MNTATYSNLAGTTAITPEELEDVIAKAKAFADTHDLPRYHPIVLPPAIYAEILTLIPFGGGAPPELAEKNEAFRIAWGIVWSRILLDTSAQLKPTCGTSGAP